MRVHKKMRDTVKQAEKMGYTVEATSNGHLRFRHSNKAVGLVIGPSTPSDARSSKNTLAQLRRNLRAAGLA